MNKAWVKCRSKVVWAMVSFILVSWAAFPLRSQDAKEAKVNLKDQAEWVSAGFKNGWMNVKDDGVAVFDEKQMADGLPSFRYSRNYKGLNLTSLPIIAVPFGLCLDDAPIDDMFLEGLARFQHTRILRLRFGPISESGMKEVGKLKDLTYLEISNLGNRANVEDAIQTKDFNDGIKQLAELTKLRVLNLSETRLADDGVKHLSKLKQVQILNLRATKITDAALDVLTGLTELKTLDLRDTMVTKGGVERLKKTLPKTTIQIE